MPQFTRQDGENDDRNDLTWQEREQLLLTQDNYISLLLENLEDIFFSYDEDWHLTRVNPIVKNILGYDPEEVTGRHIMEFVAPEYQDMIRDKAERCLKLGEKSTHEAALVAKDGSYRYFKIISAPVVVEEKVIGGMGLARDITAQMEMEQHLTESENLYQTIFENTGTAMIIIDEDMTVLKMNSEAERLIGVDRSEVEGKLPWFYRFEESDRRRMIEYHHLRRRSPGKAPRNYECTLVNRRGERREINMTVELIPGTGKSVASLLDVTERNQAMRALEASEEQLRKQLDYFNTLIENMNEGFCAYDLNGVITFVNSRAASFMGAKPHDLIGKNAIDLIPAERQEYWRERMQQRLAEGTPLTFEISLIDYKGDPVVYRVNSAPILEDGQVIGGMLTAIDITEQRKAEQKLIESERQLRAITENMIDLVVQVSVEGAIEYISPSVRNLAGVEPEDCLGLNFEDFVHPKDLPYVKQIYSHMLEHKTSETVECRIIVGKKQSKWMQINVKPILDENGSVARWVASARDITEQREAQEALRMAHEELEATLGELTAAEEQLRRQYQELQKKEAILAESERRFRSMLESMQLIALLTDAQGLIKFCNNYLLELTGWTMDEVLDKSYFEVFVRPEVRDVVYQYLDELWKSGSFAYHGESTIVTRDGRRRRIRWNANRLLDDTGRFEGVVAIGEDITEQREAEKHIQYLSLHDKLTGLYNRVYFEEEMARIERTKVPSAIIIADVDGLKLVNDSLGHEAGDQLLISAARLIQDSAGDENVAARVGGDEFAILVVNASLPKVEDIVNRILEGVEQYNQTQPEAPLSLSIGYALNSEGDLPMARLYSEADNSMYREKLHRQQSARSAIVQALMKALEERDFITEGHGERLQNMVVELARAVGLPRSSENDLRLLARFHDIGKVGIPDHILFKPGPLSREEYEVMKRHCEIGYRIALSAPDLVPIADWILKHQEWWNGKGYPLGLKGEEIPVECRILAIADAFDAMTSDRPYRKALSVEEAIDELKRCAGTQFDPELVKHFVRLFEEGTGFNFS